ncbi:MAG: DUF1540 domain-containing protein [bacterium]|nr:DUF1540 domain-containing protein [bacterium]
MSPTVKCEVNTCTHWLPGERCGAGNVDVLHEEESQMSRSAQQTQCKTFYQRRGVANLLGSMDNVNWGGLASAAFQPGGAISPSVTCTVNSCRYWGAGNLCQADEIQVTGEGADESQDTNCHTFDLAQESKG